MGLNSNNDDLKETLPSINTGFFSMIQQKKHKPYSFSLWAWIHQPGSFFSHICGSQHLGNLQLQIDNLVLELKVRSLVAGPLTIHTLNRLSESPSRGMQQKCVVVPHDHG